MRTALLKRWAEAHDDRLAGGDRVAEALGHLVQEQLGEGEVLLALLLLDGLGRHHWTEEKR